MLSPLTTRHSHPKLTPSTTIRISSVPLLLLLIFLLHAIRRRYKFNGLRPAAVAIIIVITYIVPSMHNARSNIHRL